jgi:integrase/recombinase XerD
LVGVHDGRGRRSGGGRARAPRGGDGGGSRDAGAPGDAPAAYVHESDGTYLVRISPTRDRKGKRVRVRWKVDAYYAGHRADTRASATFSRQSDADECAARLWSDYVGGLHAAPEAAPQTLRTLIDRFKERTSSKRGKALSDTTPRTYESQLGPLLRVAGEDCPLGHLSRRHVEAALAEPNQRKKGDKAPKTVAQLHRAMRALVNWALAKGWMSTDVMKGVVVDAGPDEMRPFLQPEEIEPFLAACPPAHRLRAGLIIETGLRASEAAHLRWDWVVKGIGRPSIKVPAQDASTGFRTKGRRVRAIPLSTRAQAFLTEAKERWGEDGFVLHDQLQAVDTGNWCDDTHLGCERAGVTDTDTHGLRRTAGVVWIASGLDIYTVSRLLGHSSVVVTEKSYAGIADSRLTSAMDNVDARASLPAIGRKGPWRKQKGTDEAVSEDGPTGGVTRGTPRGTPQTKKGLRKPATP